MYTLKSIVQRGALFGAAASLVAAAVLPSAAVFADALNPLTDRSLLLSSSAPGWQDTDGSGNSTASPNSVNENYAPAGSGPNGKKTGETFTFKVSSTATVRGFSLQYCTKAAGICQAPGNNTGDAKSSDRAENDAALGGGGHLDKKSDLDFVGTWTEGAAAGGFSVLVDGVADTGWTMVAANLETQTHPDPLTGKDNYVTLVKSTGRALTSGQIVKIVFTASENTYITNPGANEFFVKINTYSSDTNLIGSHNDATPADETDHTVVDGGVTVANVMTDSIHITTKVLETMAFSVGTENPDTLENGGGGGHGTCQRINQVNNNRLSLGDVSAEYSLETGKSYDQHSYWRLSSNSSGGATVYYSGDTLRNTVGDSIADMPTKAYSLPGTEQFGLGFVDAGLDTVSTTFQALLDAPDTRYKKASSYPFITVTGQSAVTTPQDFSALTAQPVSLDYADATGTIDNGSGAAGTAQFKFLEDSLTTPEPIAQQNETVISCATAKMRYVANIGADTPAGVYTTKINYLAAPQY